jgi:hypothetical protein
MSASTEVSSSNMAATNAMSEVKQKYSLVSTSKNLSYDLTEHYERIIPHLHEILPIINRDNIAGVGYPTVYMKYGDVEYRFHRVGYDSNAPAYSIGTCTINSDYFYIVEN